jgi:hypothetical protein
MHDQIGDLDDVLLLRSKREEPFPPAQSLWALVVFASGDMASSKNVDRDASKLTMLRSAI